MDRDSSPFHSITLLPFVVVFDYIHLASFPYNERGGGRQLTQPVITICPMLHAIIQQQKSSVGVKRKRSIPHFRHFSLQSRSGSKLCSQRHNGHLGLTSFIVASRHPPTKHQATHQPYTCKRQSSRKKCIHQIGGLGQGVSLHGSQPPHSRATHHRSRPRAAAFPVDASTHPVGLIPKRRGSRLGVRSCENQWRKDPQSQSNTFPIGTFDPNVTPGLDNSSKDIITSDVTCQNSLFSTHARRLFFPSGPSNHTSTCVLEDVYYKLGVP